MGIRTKTKEKRPFEFFPVHMQICKDKGKMLSSSLYVNDLRKIVEGYKIKKCKHILIQLAMNWKVSIIDSMG